MPLEASGGKEPERTENKDSAKAAAPHRHQAAHDPPRMVHHHPANHWPCGMSLGGFSASYAAEAFWLGILNALDASARTNLADEARQRKAERKQRKDNGQERAA